MLLNVLSCSVSLLLLYSIVKGFVDARSALLAACMMGCHAGFLGANGWSYVFGGSIAYMFVSYACLIKSARSSHPARYLILAGMSWAALIYTYIAWVIFTPVCVFLYLAGKDQQLR